MSATSPTTWREGQDPSLMEGPRRMGPGRQRRTDRGRPGSPVGSVDPEGRQDRGDYKEIDLLHRQLERQARIQRYQGGGTETDLNPELAKRNEGPKRQAQAQRHQRGTDRETVEAFLDGCFDYQKDWYRAGNQRTRVILSRDRSVPRSTSPARALIDALETGRNQIFLSASKAQAHIFKAYIQAFAARCGRCRTEGRPIILPNGAELHFLVPTRGLPRATTATSTSTSSSGRSSSRS
ncbi:terminase, ATPase subunit, gpP-related protein [Pseudomonas aeruginosa]|nr:terminase, ATPase subunit, gpP-related protein [Pseudomonas aeruginosa]